MRLATLKVDGRETACLLADAGFVPLAELNARRGTDWPEEMLALISSGRLAELDEWRGSGEVESMKDAALAGEAVQFAALYRRPRKIWGIGLNYREHAADLDEQAPATEPASFMKPDTAIIGHGEEIIIPRQSEKTTAEAELGLIFGKQCKDVAREDWLSVVAGFTTIIDMTAEDILRRNPRYLTMSKSFDAFFSFGPVLVTPDEIDDVSALNVQTIINGQVHAANTVSNMTFPPDFLVEFHTAVWTALPGDIISTGTPGAVRIADGDSVECRIDGFETLVNPVRDLKKA